MPIQRPKDFRNTAQYGPANTLRGVARANILYVEFFNSAGQQQKRLLIERVHKGGVDYLELEGADRAMKPANDDLVTEVRKWITKGLGSAEPQEVQDVGELKVNTPPPPQGTA